MPAFSRTARAGSSRARCGVGDAGEVQDDVAAGDERPRRGVARVDALRLDAGGVRPAGPAGPREPEHVVAALGEQRRGAPAEEPGDPRDEELHPPRYSRTVCS